MSGGRAHLGGAWLLALLSYAVLTQAQEYEEEFQQFSLQNLFSIEKGNLEQFHFCIYRDYAPLPNPIFQHYAGYGCYTYGVKSRFQNKPLQIVTCLLEWNENKWKIPCGKTSSNKTVLFTQEYEDVIASTFRSDLVMDKYRACFQQAYSCCNAMTNDTTSTADSWCPMTWDGWQCWPSTPAGSTQQELCQDHMYAEQGPSCQHFSSKECLNNGTWRAHTDLEGCDVTPRIQARMLYHSAILGLSICACVPAIVIFISYKKLRVSRMSLHRNLLIAILLHNSLTIVIKTEIFFDAAQHNTDPDNQSLLMLNGVPCRVLAFFEKFTGQAIYTMMLLEAVYLHRQIAAAFRGPPKSLWLYLFGAVLTAVPMFAWTVSTALLQDNNCWIVQDDELPLQWITDSFRILVLVINGILLIDIIRVLVTKIHSIRNIASQNTRKMVRVLLFLIPLFGLQFAVVSVRPNILDCPAEQAYYYFANTVDGLQGACVALLFCYLNKEVQILLRISCIQLKNKVRINKLNRSSNQDVGRRITFTTMVENTPPAKLNEEAPLSPRQLVTTLRDGFDNSSFAFGFESPPPYSAENCNFPLDQQNVPDQTTSSRQRDSINNVLINDSSSSGRMDPRAKSEPSLEDPVENLSGSFQLHLSPLEDEFSPATFYSGFPSDETSA